MSSELVDGLVREYLLYRGFSHSLKVFDNELKSDRDKGLRPDKITDQIMAYVTSHDIHGKDQLHNAEYSKTLRSVDIGLPWMR